MLALLLGIGLLMPAASVSACGPVAENVPGSQLAVVSGQIAVAEDAGLPNAHVQLKSASGERRYTHTDENGCYRFHAPPGEYSVLVHGFRTPAATVHLSSEHAVVWNVRVPLDGCNGCVRGEGIVMLPACVVDATGTPVAEVDVVLTPAESSQKSAPISIHGDDWGCWVAQLHQGTYRYSVNALGFEPVRKTVQMGERDEPFQTLTLVRTAQ